MKDKDLWLPEFHLLPHQTAKKSFRADIGLTIIQVCGGGKK